MYGIFFINITRIITSEFAQPGSRLAKASTRLMVERMFSTKKVIIFFGSGAVSDFNIFDASFFCKSTERPAVKPAIVSYCHKIKCNLGACLLFQRI